MLAGASVEEVEGTEAGKGTEPDDRRQAEAQPQAPVSEEAARGAPNGPEANETLVAGAQSVGARAGVRWHTARFRAGRRDRLPLVRGQAVG
jgi:hypothetical protein